MSHCFHFVCATNKEMESIYTRNWDLLIKCRLFVEETDHVTCDTSRIEMCIWISNQMKFKFNLHLNSSISIIILFQNKCCQSNKIVRLTSYQLQQKILWKILILTKESEVTKIEFKRKQTTSSTNNKMATSFLKARLNKYMCVYIISGAISHWNFWAVYSSRNSRAMWRLLPVSCGFLFFASAANSSYTSDFYVKKCT